MRLIQLDVCNPGFFAGHSGPVLVVSVDGATTIADLREGLLDDATASDMFDGVPIERLIEEATEPQYGANDDSIVYPSLDVLTDEQWEDGESCCAYFGLID